MELTGIQIWIRLTPKPTLFLLCWMEVTCALPLRKTPLDMLLCHELGWSIQQTRPFRHCSNSTLLGMAQPCQVSGSKEVMGYMTFEGLDILSLPIVCHPVTMVQKSERQHIGGRVYLYIMAWTKTIITLWLKVFAFLDSPICFSNVKYICKEEKQWRIKKYSTRFQGTLFCKWK